MTAQTIEQSSSKTKRRLVKTGITLSIALVLMFAVRTAVAEVYTVPMGSMEPELPRGSRVLVLKVGENYTQGRIIAYRDGNGPVLLGRVVRRDQGNGEVVITRNGIGPLTVKSSDVIGRVVMNTR